MSGRTLVVALVLGLGLVGCRSTGGDSPGDGDPPELGSSIEESDPEVLRREIARHREAAVQLVRQGYRRSDPDARRSALGEAIEEIEASRRKLLRLWADAAPGDRPAIDREIELAEDWIRDLRRDVPPDVDAIRERMRERRSDRTTAGR